MLTNAINALIFQTIKFFNCTLKINRSCRQILRWQYNVVIVTPLSFVVSLRFSG